MSVFLATYFETNEHFDSNVKLFPVIYANYRSMTDDRRQTETLLHHVSLAAQCLGSIIGRMHRVAMTATMYSENAMSTTQLLGAASHIY